MGFFSFYSKERTAKRAAAKRKSRRQTQKMSDDFYETTGKIAIGLTNPVLGLGMLALSGKGKKKKKRR